MPARPDLARSRALLRDAGVPLLRLTLYNPPGRSTEAEDQVLFGPLVTAGLAELVHVELASSDFWSRAHDGRLSIFRAGWIADYPDADNFLHFLLNSRAQTVYGLGYQNADLDRLTNEARVSASTPPAARSCTAAPSGWWARTAPSSRCTTTEATRRPTPRCRGCGCTRRRPPCASTSCGWTPPRT